MRVPFRGGSRKSVVLLSGGLDSAVNFKMALDCGDVVTAITFNYGQRAWRQERSAAAKMCKRFGVRHMVLALEWLGQLAPTPLTTRNRPLPHLQRKDLDGTAGQRISDTVWVPNRNGVFVNIGAAVAEASGATQVVAGFNAEEAARFPDNRPEFIRATNAALRWGTRGRVCLVSYTQTLDKAAILTLGRRVEAPLDLCWVCYDGSRRPCGRCESCLRFRRAAERAGMVEWLLALGVMPCERT